MLASKVYDVITTTMSMCILRTTSPRTALNTLQNRNREHPSSLYSTQGIHSIRTGDQPGTNLLSRRTPSACPARPYQLSEFLPIRTDGIFILQPDPHRLELQPLPYPSNSLSYAPYSNTGSWQEPSVTLFRSTARGLGALHRGGIPARL